MPHLPRPAARPRADLRRRGAQGRRRDRAHPRVPGPLPRARRGDQPDRGHRPRRPAHPRAAGPAGRRRGHRDHPRHRPQPRGRGDRDLPGPPAAPDGPAGHPARVAACRWAATWSTPTRSPWAARSREGGCSMSDDLSRLAEETALDARAYLVTVTDVASGAGPGHRHPDAAAGRLPGARRRRPARRHHRRRAGRALRGRPRSGRRRRPRCARAWPTCSRGSTTTPTSSTRSLGVEVARGSLSDDLAEWPWPLTHGLQHYDAGRVTEALWWWQFSYLSTGATARARRPAGPAGRARPHPPRRRRRPGGRGRVRRAPPLTAAPRGDSCRRGRSTYHRCGHQAVAHARTQ